MDREPHPAPARHDIVEPDLATERAGSGVRQGEPQCRGARLERHGHGGERALAGAITPNLPRRPVLAGFVVASRPVAVGRDFVGFSERRAVDGVALRRVGGRDAAGPVFPIERGIDVRVRPVGAERVVHVLVRDGVRREPADPVMVGHAVAGSVPRDESHALAVVRHAERAGRVASPGDHVGDAVGPPVLRDLEQRSPRRQPEVRLPRAVVVVDARDTLRRREIVDQRLDLGPRFFERVNERKDARQRAPRPLLLQRGPDRAKAELDLIDDERPRRHVAAVVVEIEDQRLQRTAGRPRRRSRRLGSMPASRAPSGKAWSAASRPCARGPRTPRSSPPNSRYAADV